MLAILNLCKYNEGFTSHEINLKLNTNYIIGDFKLLKNRNTQAWTSKLDFQIQPQIFKDIRWLPAQLRSQFEKNNMVFGASIKPEVYRLGGVHQIKLLANEKATLLLFGCMQSVDPSRGPDYSGLLDPNRVFFNYGVELKLKL